MKAIRISKKTCNEAAEVLGATFYGRDEWDCSGKVYVKLNDELHTFKTNGDAFDWMMDIINSIDELGL